MKEWVACDLCCNIFTCVCVYKVNRSKCLIFESFDWTTSILYVSVTPRLVVFCGFVLWFSVLFWRATLPSINPACVPSLCLKPTQKRAILLGKPGLEPQAPHKALLAPQNAPSIFCPYIYCFYKKKFITTVALGCLIWSVTHVLTVFLPTMYPPCSLHYCTWTIPCYASCTSRCTYMEMIMA